MQPWDKFFLNKKKAGLVDFFRFDAPQASEVFVYAVSLLTGPAIKLLFNHKGFGLPWGKVYWKSRTKECDNGS